MYAISVNAILRPKAHGRNYIKLEMGQKREDCKVSMQYRGLTEAGLAQGKNLSVGAIPRLTGKLGLLEDISKSVDAVSRLTNLILIGLSVRQGEYGLRSRSSERPHYIVYCSLSA